MRQDTSGAPAGGWYPGKRADFTVLDVDPFRVSPAEWLRGKVVLTVSRGASDVSAAKARRPMAGFSILG